MVDSQDVVAEAVERVLGKLLELDLSREGALMSYLRQVFKNLMVDKIRAADRRPSPVTLDDQLADDGQSPLERALDRERLERSEEALQRLKPRDAAVILLRMEQQASYDEIALHTGLPTANAARVAVRRAVFRLAHEMSRLHRPRRSGADGDGL